ncbi:MAG: PEP-CTERM sorting domain-containing protein [Pirellulales bacterium]|nr:PEP-CTERM sorting domain-containing protein [Pirellulales bacterium]
MRKKMTVQKARKQRKKNWKSGLQAGCLALGMATAWGGEAHGDTLFQIAVTPSTDIRNAYVYYGSNTSGRLMTSLGTLLANETTIFLQTHWADPEDFKSPEGHADPAYALIGLYGDVNDPGIAISFPNDVPIRDHRTWASYFETTGFPAWDTSESEVIWKFDQAIGGFDGYVETFIGIYGSHTSDPCGIPYGQTGTIVCFSDAQYGGVITVTPVPEPAAWILLVTATGALLFWRRDLLHR